jgi:hypothetical protein
MDNLPFYISLIFILTTLLSLGIFYMSGKSLKVLIVLVLSLMLQAGVAMTGFYTVTDTLPPRFLFVIGPAVILTVILFCTEKGRQYIDSLNIKTLTILQTIRLPVEIVLHWLFLYKLLPEIITYEGRNFDIFTGITAPLIYYFGFVKMKLGKGLIIGWNLLCAALLINVVFHGVLSVPFPFQQFGFEQPNIAMMHFPFIWLPAFVVPLVFFAHLVTIRQLIRRNVEDL